MSEITAMVKAKATEYGAEVSNLAVGLAIEAYKDARHYPPSYNEDAIRADMQTNIYKIAMAAVEIDSKDGMENQTSHSENGITRGYASGIMAYRDVVGFGLVV